MRYLLALAAALTVSTVHADQIWDYSNAVTGTVTTETPGPPPGYDPVISNAPLTGTVNVQLVLSGPATDPVLQSIMITEPSGIANLSMTGPFPGSSGQYYSLGPAPDFIQLDIGPKGFEGAEILEASTGSPDGEFSFQIAGANVELNSTFGNQVTSAGQQITYNGSNGTWKQVPELDLSSAIAAITLLAGCGLMVRGRYSR